ncbi:MAG: ABC transporter permease [Sporomusaceae bacterium]|nr:ABC transporter permease [Sporomusaceae bacterium]
MNLWQIIKREFRQMFVQDPKRVVYLFGASAIYILLFGLLYGTHVVNAVPTVVYDEDQTTLSRSLLQAFADSERYQIVAYVTSQEEMEKYLHSKQAFAAINIPSTFSHNAKLGLSTPVLLEINGTNLMIANTAMSAAQEIIQAFSNNMGSRLIQSTGQMPAQALHKAAPVALGLRVLHNATLSYLDFFVLGLAIAALQQGILLSVSASMIYEYQNMQELKDVSTFSVMVGKLLPYWLCGTLAFVMALIISSQAFHIPFNGPFASLLVLGTVFSFTITAFASLMAAYCKTEVTFTQFSLAYAVPGFVFSGYTWPQYTMDTISTVISYTFPITYVADTVRALMIAGHAPALQKNILILLIIGVILLALSTLVYINKRKHLSDSPENRQLSQF